MHAPLEMIVKPKY